MPDTRNAKDCLELPPTRFLHFNELIWLASQYSIVFYFVLFCIDLVSPIWFLHNYLSCNICLWYYGHRSTLIKKLKQTYIVIVSGSILNISSVHLNGIWHVIWRYLSEPVLGGHPVLSGHYSIPEGCPLNTGFTVLAIGNSDNSIQFNSLLASDRQGGGPFT